LVLLLEQLPSYGASLELLEQLPSYGALEQFSLLRPRTSPIGMVRIRHPNLLRR
jgi:hypothetical protein